MSPRLALDRGPAAFLASYEDAVRPLAIADAEAFWAFTRTGRGEPELTAAAEALQAVHDDPNVRPCLREWLRDQILDALTRRCLAVLEREFADPAEDPALRRRILQLHLRLEAAHQDAVHELRGQAVDLRRLDGVLARERDRALREQAWRASRSLGVRLAGDVRELARLRNEAARALGFVGHWQRAMAENEHDASWVEALLDAVEAQTEQPWRRCAEERDERQARWLGYRGELQAWDHFDRFGASLPSDDPSLDARFRFATIARCVRTWFSRIGLPIGPVWDVSDLEPRPGKANYAFTIGVDNPWDVRVLATLDGTHRRLETALHEFGHAAYNAGIDPELPWVLREPAHTCLTEAVAMLCARRAHRAQWLVDLGGISWRRAERAEAAGEADRLCFLRWALVVARFERALYADPDADLDGIWWGLVERLQGIPRPDRASGDWAAKVHVACSPLYFQEYVVGDRLADELDGPDEGLGERLRPLFAAGRSRPWHELVALPEV